MRREYTLDGMHFNFSIDFLITALWDIRVDTVKDTLMLLSKNESKKAAFYAVTSDLI